jgi:uncharacterized protein (TIGR00725 family)
LKQAEVAGRLIAEAGAVLLCGGRTGIMEAAAKGAKSVPSGEVLAVLPGPDPDGANPYVDLAVATGMGNGRNIINVLTSDAVIAFQGGPGTLSEIALAVKCGIHTIGLDTWNLQDAGKEAISSDVRKFFHSVRTAEEAVALALRHARKPLKGSEEIESSILGTLESRIQCWNAKDMAGFLDLYRTAEGLAVVFEGRMLCGFEAVSSFFKDYCRKPPGSALQMKIDPPSLRVLPMPGRAVHALYRCFIDEDGSAGNAWICTSLFMEMEGDYRIVLEHLSEEGKQRKPA